MRELRRWIALVALLVLSGLALALPLSQYSRTAGSNNMTVPDGAPENWTGSQINDWGRQWMKVVRDWYDDPQWLEITYDLATRGTKTFSRVDADTLDILSTNAVSYYPAGRRIQIVGSSTVTCYVASAALNGSDTRIEVGTSCSVPTSPTAANVYFGADLRSGAFGTAGQTAAGLTLGRGLFHGRIAYVSATQVSIARGYNQKLAAEVDGVLVESASDLTLDITTADRENTAACGGSASETASTWYYLYLDEVSGSLAEFMSSTAPVMDPASGKVGYHPGTCGGSTGWRAIGAVFNNSLSNIEPFDYDTASGLWTFRSLVSAFSEAPGLGSQTTYALVALTGQVPLTARLVRIQASVQQENAKYYYGHESLSALTVSTNRSPNYLLVDIENSDNNPADSSQFEIPIDATPNVAWGNVMGTVETADEHNLEIVGWRDGLGLVR